MQDFYDSFTGDDRLFYERRSHEYDNIDMRINKSNIITLPIQLLAMLSMFLEEPHSVHRYYGELLKSYRQRLFQDDHQLIAYYTSAWVLHRIESSLKRGLLSSKYRKFRYHILFMLQVCSRKQLAITDIPRPNSNSMQRLCNYILETFSDNGVMKDFFKKIIPIIDSSVEQMNELYNIIDLKQVIKRKDFTSLLDEHCKKLNLKFK